MSLDLFLKKVGKNIARVRRSADVTQKALSEKVGISYRYYQNIESGAANITLATLFRIARHFDMSPAHLLPRDEFE